MTNLRQATDHVFLVRPKSFGYNLQTALSNTFQNNILLDRAIIQDRVASEFQSFAQTLRDKGIQVMIFDDTANPVKPDAVFPNNWISCHEDGTMVLYPMCTPNRREERRADIVETLKRNFNVTRTLDLTHYEQQNRFLEGTGSIIFDHPHRVAYACGSVRTDRTLFEQLCNELGYRSIFFHAENAGVPIYHTNVMMCVGDRFAIVALDSIANTSERTLVASLLKETHHEIVEITMAQLNSFAGNMLLLQGAKGNVLALSQCAFDALDIKQLNALEHYSELLPLAIPTIEGIGGGSARCMIAEIFLKPLL